MTRLAPEERDALRTAYATNWLTLLAYVTELADAYHAAGLVEGDLGHDGTVRWEAQA